MFVGDKFTETSEGHAHTHFRGDTHTISTHVVPYSLIVNIHSQQLLSDLFTVFLQDTYPLPTSLSPAFIT